MGWVEGLTASNQKIWNKKRRRINELKMNKQFFLNELQAAGF